MVCNRLTVLWKKGKRRTTRLSYNCLIFRQSASGVLNGPKEGNDMDSERRRRFWTAWRKSTWNDAPNNQGSVMAMVNCWSQKSLGSVQVGTFANGSKVEFWTQILPTKEICIGIIDLLLPTQKPPDGDGNHVVLEMKSFLPTYSGQVRRRSAYTVRDSSDKSYINQARVEGKIAHWGFLAW